jgi:hypothetical protein
MTILAEVGIVLEKRSVTKPTPNFQIQRAAQERRR